MREIKENQPGDFLDTLKNDYLNPWLGLMTFISRGKLDLRNYSIKMFGDWYSDSPESFPATDADRLVVNKLDDLALQANNILKTSPIDPEKFIAIYNQVVTLCGRNEFLK